MTHWAKSYEHFCLVGYCRAMVGFFLLQELLQSNLTMSGANKVLKLVWGAHIDVLGFNGCQNGQLDRVLRSIYDFTPKGARNDPKRLQNAQNDAIRNSCFLKTTSQHTL